MNEENKPKFVSPTFAFSELKADLIKKGMDVFNHIIIGVDMDNENRPVGVLSSIKGSGYIALGMLEGVQAIIDRLKDEILEGYGEALGGNKHSHPMSGRPDPEVMKIIMKYENDLITAMIKKDRAAMDEIKAKIIKEIIEIKGKDFNVNMIFGMPPGMDPDNKENPDQNRKPNSGFNFDDISKYT